MANPQDGVDSAETENWQLEQEEEKQLTTIIVRNVNEMTVAGLRRLCSQYGTVVNAFKIKTGGTAFVEFSNDGEAGRAIQQLNLKLGFNYNAELATPKETLPTIEHEESAAPVPEENWEQISAKRRFNVGFSLPLLINFPERESLATNVHYRSSEGHLRQTDPSSFFRIYKVMEWYETTKTLDYDPVEMKKCVDFFQKTYANEGNRFEGETLVYEGLAEKESTQFKVTRCVVCRGYGFSYCKGCNTYYCSVQHQRQHYEQHKLLCSKRAAGDSQRTTPEIVTKDEKMPERAAASDKVLTRDPLPAKLKVFITSILTPDRIYVRSAAPAADTMYLATLGDFAHAGLTAARLDESKGPVAGDIYLAMYKPLGVHGRVLVVEDGPERSKCVFIDHGTVAFISNGELLTIEDTELLYRKVPVYKVCLTDITDEHGEHEKAMQYLAKLRDRPLEMKYRLESNNIIDVQLQTPEGESVNEQLNKLIIIPPIAGGSSQHDGRGDVRNETFVMYKEIPQSEPSYGENKLIMILNRTTVLGDCRITWIAMADLPYLENLQLMLESYGKKVSEFRQPYVPREGEMCLVRCLNRWYRGVCYETAGDGKPAIFLCDYGSMTLVDLSNIRKIPPQLATKPMRTHDGTVEHLGEAKADGLVLDSVFLDIYLPENEPIRADISQRVVSIGLPGAEQEESCTMLNLHELSELLTSKSS